MPDLPQSIAVPVATDLLHSELDAAILRTVLYADVFEFPLRPAELHHFLIGSAMSRDEVESVLTRSEGLKAYIELINGYVVLRARAYMTEQRTAHEDASALLWNRAIKWGRLLARLPFVRMVALTGALAMRNAENAEDDLDYLIVTTAKRVWTARAASIVMVRIGRLFGVRLCPNYVLAETALEQTRQDLFIAHEITQMIPLSGRTVYDAMRAANQWTALYLPNATSPFHTVSEIGKTTWVQRILERMLNGRLGDAFERWEMNRKIRRFAGELHRANTSAQLDAEHVKGHFNDYGYPALDQYHDRLRRYHLEG